MLMRKNLVGVRNRHPDEQPHRNQKLPKNARKMRLGKMGAKHDTKII